MIGLPNPYLILAAALAFAAATGGAYIKGRIDGTAIEQSRQAKLEDVARTAREAAVTAAANAIADIEVKQVTIRQQAVKEIIRDPVYTECRNTDEFMRLLNAARGYDKWQPAVPAKLPAVTAD